MTAPLTGAAVDTLGKRLQGRCPPVGPRAALRATPRPRLLHHASGRQRPGEYSTQAGANARGKQAFL